MSRTKIGILIHTPLRDQLFSPEDMRRLESLGEVVRTDSPTAISVDEACRLLADCQVAIGSWGTPGPTEQVIKSCPKLRLWEYAAGSVKHLFGPHLAGSNLVIASCAPANAENVAEFTLGELIFGLRRVYQNATANRRTHQNKPANSKVLSSSVVGIVGASQVGRRVIRMIKPFEPKILLFDPYVDEAEAKALGVTLVRDLVDLCAASDVVSLHAPWLPSTEKMMGVREFKAMKDDAVFINTARGACVDEAALIAELQKGRLFAMLDVTWPEPPADDSPLRTLPNVLYTSHIAGMAHFKFGQQAVDDIAAFLSGGSPLMVVTQEQLSRLA